VIAHVVTIMSRGNAALRQRSRTVLSSRQTLPGETVSNDVQKQNFRTCDPAFRESLALIRSILIDSGPLRPPRAHFFTNYFRAVHEAVRRKKISL
jgi:hypothetical protein